MLQLFLLLCAAVLGAWARPCKCYFGVVVVSEPQCECECDSGFMLPRCQFKAAEDARVQLYINRTILRFSGSALEAGINDGALTEEARIYLIEKLTAFDKLAVIILIPGFAVQRLLDAVESRQPWAQLLDIESAYVMVRPLSKRSSVFEKMVIYESGSIVITVDGIAWILSGALLDVAAGPH